LSYCDTLFETSLRHCPKTNLSEIFYYSLGSSSALLYQHSSLSLAHVIAHVRGFLVN